MTKGDEQVRAIAEAIAEESLPWTAGPTALTALTVAEQESYLGLIVTDEEHAQLSAATAATAAQEVQFGASTVVGAPASKDWRNVGGANYVTSIKNQGGCGSCVSFCSCSVMESALRIGLQDPSYAVDLSEGFMQFCGGGSCNGWGLTSGLDFAKSTGTTDEACMPYQATDMSCSTSRCSDWANRLTKITDYTGHASAEARKNAIANTGPVLAGMRVYADFMAYTGGVYVKTAGSAERGYHCVCVVGYDDSQQCWIVKNSWGTNWGESGFVRIRYGQADLLIDSDWMFYTVAMAINPVVRNNVAVTQVYASRDAQNAWGHFEGLGWRRIQAGSPDAVTNMLAVLANAAAKGQKVTIVVDGSNVHQAYL